MLLFGCILHWLHFGFKLSKRVIIESIVSATDKTAKKLVFGFEPEGIFLVFT